MKTPKSIQVAGNVLAIVKTVEKENIKTGNASFSETEKNFVKNGDFVVVKVLDKEGNALGAWVSWGEALHKEFKPGHKKQKDGSFKKVCNLLKYTKV
jgi:hypothetical protein